MPRTTNPKPSKRPAPPEWTSTATSNASRKRRAPSCSMASLRALEDEETMESDFIGYFGATSESHFTWGKTMNKPIPAAKKKGRAPRWNKRRNGESGLDALFGRREDGVSEKYLDFMGFPLEVREKVYGFIVLYAKPIIIKHDLSQVESINLRCIPILRVCRQICNEATSFIYRHNTWRAVNRNPRITYHLHDSFIIAPTVLSLFRNLIIECPKENWGIQWYINAAVAIEKLVEAKTPLQSLTLVVSPQQVGETDTVAGWVKKAVTFADFFWVKGRLMGALKRLSCKKFNIVIKKTIIFKTPAITLTKPELDIEDLRGVSNRRSMDSGVSSVHDDVPAARESIILQEPAVIRIPKRFLISLDLTYMQPGSTKIDALTNEITIMLRHEKRMVIGRQIGSLKRHFEEIFENHELAIRKGKCREIGSCEKITDLVVGC